MSITGSPGEPTKAGVALIDVLTGKDAVIGILAALAARECTGLGDALEVCLLTSSLAAMVNQGQAALETGRAPSGMGNQHPSIAAYETLRAADGPIAIACGNDGQFARLATVLGVPELATDPDYATNAARVVHRVELVRLLEERLRTASAQHWVDGLTAARVPAGRVATILDGIALATPLALTRSSTWAGVTPRRSGTRCAGPVTAPPAPPRLPPWASTMRAFAGGSLNRSAPRTP